MNISAAQALNPGPLIPVRIVTAAELPRVNLVITSAVNSWNLTDRLKRLSLPLLHYDAIDLDHFEIILYARDDWPIAVAAWQPGASYFDLCGTRSTLLHGLFVRPHRQNLGIGKEMQDVVLKRAGDLGYEGLFVKSHRLSAEYFAKHGYVRRPDPVSDYPYQFWKAIPKFTHTAT